MSSYLKLDSALNTYVTFADSGFPDPSIGGVSFAVWIRINDTNVSGVLFQKYDGVRGYQARFNTETNGDLSLEFLFDGDTSATTKIEKVPVKLGEWQLFVFIPERSETLKIYIDAVLHSDTDIVSTPTGTVSNSEDFYMGFNPTDPSTSSSGNVDIDSFSLYKFYLLQEIEIRDLYNRGRGRKIDGTEFGIDFGLNLDEGTGATVTDIVGSLTGTISSDASPFDNVWGDTGGVAVMSPSDIKLYLTSLEPYQEQKNYAQSIGGYISPSRLYPETTLASSLGLYQTGATITDATDLLGLTHVSMINEIAEVEEIDSTSITFVERGVNGTVGYYPAEVIVTGITSPLNDSFNTDRKQYRCYVVKNASPTESAFEVAAYFKQLSQNNQTIMRLALEYPKSQGITGVSTSWNSSMLIDSSLAETYEDNLFADSYLIFEDFPNENDKIRINSYDGATGTFVFADSISPDFDQELPGHSPNVNYTVEASPAQRVKSGIDMPADTDYISDFSTAASLQNAVSLMPIDGTGTMLPGEIIYVWIEREIGKSSSPYDDNSFVLSIDFEKELKGN